ncbi:hypothetical protein QBC35DRAFT_510080 [Podospora australis]|uniref:BTB domain-containing protein n=1 Tax=Podospora australis TaxID=1536484 RepID=A0AAN7ADC1_9PEZI|nr:hypothetical protein QBC35DRAFT_510080 [Podospora australis]
MCGSVFFLHLVFTSPIPVELHQNSDRNPFAKMSITVPIPSAPPHYSESATIVPPMDEQVTLNVSGQKFTTTIFTLTNRSQYFSRLFQTTHSNNAGIFIDSDPSLFHHVLQYLRRGTFPLSYDQKRGHNYKLYADLLSEARFFQLPKLECWLADQLFLRCVTISTVWSSAFKDDRIKTGFQTTSVWGSNVVSTQLVRNEVATATTAICIHEAMERNPFVCNKKYCAQPPQTIEDEVNRYRWAEVGKSIGFSHGWCSDTGREFVEYWERSSRPVPPSKS